MPRTTWRRAAAVTALVLVPVLSACSIGVNAGTTTQRPSGNGAFADSADGSIALRGVTLVTSLSASTQATLIGTVVNQSLTEDDVLTGVTIVNPTGATVTIAGPGAITSIPLPAGRPTSSQQFGPGSAVTIDVTGLTIPQSSYAQMVFTFQKAGAVPISVLAVPPVGIYAGLGPALG